MRAIVDESENCSLRVKVVEVGIHINEHTSAHLSSPCFLTSKSRITKLIQPNMTESRRKENVRKQYQRVIRVYCGGSQER